MFFRLRIVSLYWLTFYNFFFDIVKYFFNLANSFLGKYISGFLLKPSSLFLFLNYIFMYIVLTFFKYSMICKLTTLRDIVVADFPNNFTNRFELTYVFWSNFYNYALCLKLHGNSDTLFLSISNFYKSASWLEREAWDMFGIKFLFHKNLRRILTDYGFKGYPLRKDFPLIGFFELRYDDLYQSIFVEPVELSQLFRFFKFQNPWSNWN